MPVVSVIVPVYQASKTLERCIQSILMQTFTDFELILADDGSEDGSLEIELRFATLDARIRVLPLVHAGVNATRNAALAEAEGEYIVFVDADDRIAPEMLAEAVSAAERSQADTVVWDFRYIKDGIFYHISSPCQEGCISTADYAGNAAESLNLTHLAMWNKLYRRSIIEEKGLRFLDYPRWMDACFALDYLSKTQHIFILHKTLYDYLDEADSISYREAKRDGGNINRMALSAVLTHLKDFFRTVETDRKRLQWNLSAVDTRVLSLIGGPSGLRTALLMENPVATDGTREKEEATSKGSEDAITLRGTLLRGILLAADDRIALRGGDSSQACLSYVALKSAINRLGGALLREAAGQRVVVMMDSSLWSIVAFLTVLCSDCAAVPLNPQEPNDELMRKIQHVLPALVIGDSRVDVPGITIWNKEWIQQICMGQEEQPLEDMERWHALSQCADSEAYLLFTSGTTGESKCVVRSQRNVATIIAEIEKTLRYGDEQLLILPAYHIFGIEALILPAFTKGLTLNLSGGLGHWIEEIRGYCVSELFAVPAQATLLSQLLYTQRLEEFSLDYVITGGAPLPEKTRKALEKLGIQCINIYGTCEVGVVGYPEMHGDGYDIRSNAAGRLRPFVEYQLQEINTEGYGELLLKGTSVSPGYLDRSQKLSPFSPDGWYHTRDFARVDEEGFVFLKGRIDNMIILPSGENISPEAVEACFSKRESLQECLAFPYRDQLCMYVVAKGEDKQKGVDGSLAQQLFDVNATLPSWMRVEHFYRCMELSRTATGKLKRHDLPEPKESECIQMPDLESKDTPLHAVILAFQKGFGRVDVRPENDFFSMGGDSLTGMAIVAALCESGFPLGIRDLFMYPRVDMLADFITRFSPVSDFSEEEHLLALERREIIAPGIEEDVISRLGKLYGKENVEAIYTANGLYYEDVTGNLSLAVESFSYFMDQVMILNESLDRETFFERMSKIARRHPVLRSTCIKDKGARYQVILRQAEIPAFYEDRSDLPGGVEEKLSRLMEEHQISYERRRKETNPVPLTVRCYQLTRQQSVLLVELTHQDADRFSLDILLRELAAGEGLDERDHYHSYRLWREKKDMETNPEGKAFWKQFLNEVEMDNIRPVSEKGLQTKWRKMSWEDQFPIRLDRELSASVRDAAAQEHVTPIEVISFVFYRSIMEHYGMKSILFRELLRGREGMPFDARDIFAYLACDTLCFVRSTDHIRDYHDRIACCSKYADYTLRPLWKKWADAPVLMNCWFTEGTVLPQVKSVFGPIKTMDTYVPGQRMKASYLRQVGGSYQLSILHVKDETIQQELEHFSTIFRAQLARILRGVNYGQIKHEESDWHE